VSQELFDKAVHLEEAGQTEAAIQVWRDIVAAAPTRNALLRYGGAAKELGLYDEAEQAFRLALEKDPESALAMTELGLIALHQRHYDTAEHHFRGACQAEEDPGSFTLLGVALRNLCRDFEAEEAYRTAIRFDPNYEEAYFNLGVLLRDDRPSEAQRFFRMALDLDPEFSAAHRELGFVLSKRGASSEAEEHLQKCIQLKPDDGWAHIYLGTHVWDGNPDLAIKQFEVARELCPEWTVPLWSLGKIHGFVLQEYDLAQSFFEAALQLDPDDVETLLNMGRLYKRRGAPDRAKVYAERALRLCPEDLRARDLLSEVAASTAE
jgi:tetratricopeptide (TPR) repeat protein